MFLFNKVIQLNISRTSKYHYKLFPKSHLVFVLSNKYALDLCKVNNTCIC